MRRILRLYSPYLTGDLTLCYAHKNDENNTCINEVPVKINYAYCGDRLEISDTCGLMTIVFPKDTKIKHGDFLSFDASCCVLRFDEEKSCFDVIRNGFLSVSASFEIWHPMTAAVLTISDKCSKGEREDTAGPELETLALTIGAVTVERKVTADDMDAIAQVITEWSDKGYDLILTTGGTGLSKRDVTPEALLSIADKVVPGFGETMRLKTQTFTPLAFLTRSVAVIRKSTLVIAFPGSKRAVRQCFDAVSEAIRHGVGTLRGYDTECGGHSH